VLRGNARKRIDVCQPNDRGQSARQEILEMIMPERKKAALILFLMIASAAFVVSAVWLVAYRADAASALTLVPFGLSAALLAVLARMAAQQDDQVSRYQTRHKPLAGPRPGARLPR
jgi:hypothetical protein